MEQKFKKLTSTLKKDDILKRYHELLKAYQEKQQETPDKQAPRQEPEENIVVEKAAQYTTNTIVKKITDLKLDIGETLNKLSEKMSSIFLEKIKN